jgi:tetratricopeptide (TPR) repeat protein
MRSNKTNMKNRICTFLFCIFLCGASLSGGMDTYKPGPFYHRWNPVPGITFRDPVMTTLFDIRIRGGFYGYEKGDIGTYDSGIIRYGETSDSLNTISGMWSRSMGIMDVNIIRYNWPYLIIKQNIFDCLTGIGIREVRGLMAADLDPAWSNRVAYGQSFRFRPRVREVYLSQTVWYQLFSFLLVHGEYTWGLGRGELYTAGDKAYDVYVTGRGKSISGGVDWVFTPDRVTGSRISAGISVHAYSGDYNVDKSDLETPIEGIHFSGTGIQLSVRILLGTGGTSGDRGIKSMRHQDYVSASQSFAQYIRNNPRSLRIKLAETYKSHTDSMSFFQHYHKGTSLLREGRIREARQKFDIAVRTGNIDLRQAVLTQRYILAQRIVLEAMKDLKNEDYARAEVLIHEALNISPLIREEIREALSEIHIRKGISLVQVGLVDAAEKYFEKAVLEYSGNENRIIALRAEISKTTMENLRRALNEKDLIAAKYFLEESKRISDHSGRMADEFLDRIAEKIRYLENRREIPVIEIAFKKLWSEAYTGTGIETSVEQITIRVAETSEEIREKLGEPHTVKKWHPGAPVDYMLWTYRLKNDMLMLYFHNHILMKIERISRP